jgi:hypothetical protein
MVMSRVPFLYLIAVGSLTIDSAIVMNAVARVLLLTATELISLGRESAILRMGRDQKITGVVEFVGCKKSNLHGIQEPGALKLEVIRARVSGIYHAVGDRNESGVGRPSRPFPSLGRSYCSLRGESAGFGLRFG